MAFKPSTVETLVWVLLYGGLLLLSLSLFVSPRAADLGWGIAVVGAVAVAAGVVLVFVRSRMAQRADR